MLDHLHVNRVRATNGDQYANNSIPQLCTQCGVVIPPGAFFTLRSFSAMGKTYAICEQCEPFRLIDLPTTIDHYATRPLNP
jgi:hypothetical protein